MCLTHPMSGVANAAMAHPMSSAAYGYSHQPRSGSMDHGTAGHFRSYPTSQGHPHNPSSACSRRPEERYRRAEAGAVGDPRSSDKVKMTWQPCTNGNGLNLFVLNGEGVFTRAVTVPVPHSPPFGAISRAILGDLEKSNLIILYVRQTAGAGVMRRTRGDVECKPSRQASVPRPEAKKGRALTWGAVSRRTKLRSSDLFYHFVVQRRSNVGTTKARPPASSSGHAADSGAIHGAARLNSKPLRGNHRATTTGWLSRSPSKCVKPHHS